MIKIIRQRVAQGRRTIAYPVGEPPPLPDRFRGLPVLDESRCPDDCRACAAACPTDAISRDDQGLRLDMGRCLFCTECVDACPTGAIRFTQDHRLAVRARDDLVVRSNRPLSLAKPLEPKMLRLFGRSLKLRQVSAAGDNSAEADLNVLGTVVFDMGRFGIQFVASPRHADGLVVTGPVSENMKLALLKTYAAVPAPKIVIVVGACAISGGIFRDHPEVHNGAGGIVPVDLYIPGNPPHPMTILDGLLRLLDRLEQQRAGGIVRQM
jgi:Ni,Fe-hydrogenase III small subunit/NAD-dependent dihydropyrimidine dehydrogenase PreA subunit